MFGYDFGPAGQAGPDAEAPAPVLSPGDAIRSEAGQAAPPDAAPDPTVPYPAGQGLVAGKYWLGTDTHRLPVGDLFHGKDVKQETELDILLVDKSVFHSPLDMERSRRELRQLQKVDCPAIVRVLDHGKAEDERLYVVMERVAGTPLQQLVEQQPLGLGVAQSIVKSVGGGLAEAQKMGVIHRDIAPHNVLMTKNGSVKIRGFGVAAPIKRHVFGTPEFISPEQAAGRPVDQRSNIYSLGALLFYMLTGRPVFLADNVEDLLAKHQKEDPPSPNAVKPGLNLPPRAEALILKALSKSSSRRHLTLRQFLREVESLASATAAQEVVPPSQPPSFETPLHGVTALSGGRRPPSSEVPPLGRQQVIQPPRGPAAPSEAPTVQGEMSAGAVRTAASAQDEPVIPMPASPQSAGGVAKTPQRAAEPPPPAAAPPKSDAQAPPQRQSQITGELSSEVSLKKPEPEPLARQKKAPKPASGPVPSPPPGAAKGGFRETMWFFKGEVESAMAAEGDEEVVKQQEVEATPEELAAKYRDDGSLSDEAARRLSLRTGKTQAMQKVKIPSGHLPGEKMAAEDFISEMNRGKRIAIWVGIFILLAGIGGVVAWLVLH